MISLTWRVEREAGSEQQCSQLRKVDAAGCRRKMRSRQSRLMYQAGLDRGKHGQEFSMTGDSMAVCD
jgi:hypothetical protein